MMENIYGFLVLVLIKYIKQIILYYLRPSLPVPFPEGIASDGTNIWVASDFAPWVVYQFKLSVPCFAKNTQILTSTGYRYVQDLQTGDLIKTLNHGYKPLKLIGTKEINNPVSNERIKDQLYKCSIQAYPELFEDLIITGCHSILVGYFVDDKQRNKTIEVNGDTYVTDGKYRLPVCADDRAEIYQNKGQFAVYHFALENDDELWGLCEWIIGRNLL